MGLYDGQAKLHRESFPDMRGKVVIEIVEYTEFDAIKWKEKKVDIERHNMRLSLDDFTTGQNNMYALGFFMPHYAKLDRSLITGENADVLKQEENSRTDRGIS